MAGIKLLFAFSLASTVASNAVARDGTCQASQGKCSEDDPVSLMQVQLAKRAGVERLAESAFAAQSADDDAGKLSCTDLGNHGSWFSVEVDVGTPSQKFDLVADTGSNNLLIPDCHCTVDGGECNPGNACFNVKKSKTFSFDEVKQNGKVGIRAGVLAYGSGAIEVIVASDDVSVAGISTKMPDGIFLIEDRRQLRVGPNFDGILGLGLPQLKSKTPMFTTAAHVQKYTVCFAEKGGALNMNVASIPNPMKNIGTVHWGLDFRGATVAGVSVPLGCEQKDRKKGQITACAAIPDSGTTLLMGPSDQIQKLFTSLCESWPRCKKTIRQGLPAAQAFVNILHTCDTWLKKDVNLDTELPSLSFTVAGPPGSPSQIANIKPSHYIMESLQEVVKRVIGKIHGTLVEAIVDTGVKKKVCMPGFGAQVYNTIENGPIWILGSPLFFSNTVGYDTKGDLISVDPKPCTSCGKAASLLSEGMNATEEDEVPQIRRVVDIREPGLDVNQPL